MDGKLIERNLTMGCLLSILAVVLCAIAIYFKWTEIAILSGVLAVLQTCMTFVWYRHRRKLKIQSGQNSLKHHD